MSLLLQLPAEDFSVLAVDVMDAPRELPQKPQRVDPHAYQVGGVVVDAHGL